MQKRQLAVLDGYIDVVDGSKIRHQKSRTSPKANRTNSVSTRVARGWRLETRSAPPLKKARGIENTIGLAR